MKRRSFLAGAAAASSIAVPIPAAQSLSADPLLALITIYRKSLEPDCPDFCEEEFSATTKELNAWTGPAPSRASAIAALELAITENRDYADSPTAKSLISAAMRFIESS